jgi:CRP-like cAMP-binding protein
MLNQGTYFGEIEILRKTYRDSTSKAIDNSFLLTLKKQILWEDIIANHSDYFHILLDNMIKRHNFNERVRDIVKIFFLY